MSIKNGLPPKIKLAATLSAETNPNSPVIMSGDPAERIAFASHLGYDAIELHWGNPANIPLKEIIKACSSNYMKVSAFATGRSYVEDGLSLIDPEESIRLAAINRLKEYVDAASAFEATVIIGCIRGNLSAEMDKTVAMNHLLQSTITIAEYAQEKHVGIVFEAINRYENNYLNTAKETLDFIRNNNLPNTKVLLDTFHMNIEDGDLEQEIINCGELLGYFHIADSNRHYAGNGHINFNPIINALKTIDYQGFLSAECLPLPDSDTALSGWIRGVKNAF